MSQDKLLEELAKCVPEEWGARYHDGALFFDLVDEDSHDRPVVYPYPDVPNVELINAKALILLLDELERFGEVVEIMHLRGRNYNCRVLVKGADDFEYDTLVTEIGATRIEAVVRAFIAAKQQEDTDD